MRPARTAASSQEVMFAAYQSAGSGRAHRHAVRRARRGKADRPLVRSDAVTTLGPIGQIHITASDIGRSVAFYRDALGLPLLFEVPEQRMAFLDAGGVRLYLAQAESPEFESHPLLYFRVDDIAAAHRDLAARGVAFTDEPHVVHRNGSHELWLAFFRDPDGAPLALMAEVAI